MCIGIGHRIQSNKYQSKIFIILQVVILHNGFTTTITYLLGNARCKKKDH